MASFFFFCLFYLAGEAASHTRPFQSFLVYQTWDSRHRAFEMQLSRLDRVVKEEGHIPCIFLGNSMVWLGFDPEAFQNGYREKTGEQLQCFNFGVDGMPAQNAGVLATILVEDYQPELLIYGIDARDLAVPPDSQDALVLSEMPWLQYRLGKFSPKGWLVEHSNLYRHRIALQHILRFDYRYTVRNDPDANRASRYGFDPDPTVGDVEKPPDPADSRYHVQYYFKMLSNYRIRPENLAGLDRVLEQKPFLDSLLIVELPVPVTYLDFFGDGNESYRLFLNQVDTHTRENQVSFWHTSSWNVIPNDGWVDYSHLNNKGAAIFSYVLGSKVGQAVFSGELQMGAR